uniref:Uncharacterized protein n=2 Tax=Timema TaxID=61471 RepID=A0A7R9JVC8_TIMGE|nr:unnamed protein product [Timema genevievae]
MLIPSLVATWSKALLLPMTGGIEVRISISDMKKVLTSPFLIPQPDCCTPICFPPHPYNTTLATVLSKLFVWQGIELAPRRCLETLGEGGGGWILWRSLLIGSSGSGSVIGRDPLPPRSVSAMSLQQQQKIGALLPPPTITLTTSEDKKQTNGGSPGDQVKSPHTPTAQTSTPNHVGSLHPTGGGISPHDGTEETQGKRARGGGGGPPPSGSSPWNLNVSAGELLGHTHEELVLLLIQLRRQSAGVCKAMEMCHVEIEAQVGRCVLSLQFDILSPELLGRKEIPKARLAELDTPRRLEHLQKLEDLKKHLLDLEKQYEKGKPLVNLVDNMVKLGSLYRGGGAPLQSGGEVPSVRERLEFNQKVQEQRLLAQEKRDWDRLSPDQGQLQAKVQELYRLDRLLQEESGTLQSLQQDKKLEETVAENARLEQELVVLRQKWQASRRGSGQSRSMPMASDSGSPSNGTTAALEAELRRVQQLVGDLQRQRQELSMQVRQLTEKSHSLVQQMRPGPTGVAGAGPIPGRKRHHSTWLETDLDSLVTLDHGLNSPASPQHQVSSPTPSRSPLYVNADTNKRIDTNSYDDGSMLDGEDLVPPPLPAPPELPPDYPPPPPPPPSEEAILNGGLEQQYCTQMDISEADDRMKRFYGIIPREKQQEIKTVRIVKRESERRQRDRDRSGNIGIPITNGNVTGGGKRIMISEDTGEIITSPHHEKSSLGRVLEEDTHQHETDLLTLQYPEDDPVLAQFHRSMSLPRGFGKRPPAIPPPPPVRVPSPRSDSVTALRNLVMGRQRVRFESCSGGSSSAESTNSQRTASPNSQNSAHRQLTAHEQLFGGGSHIYLTSPGSSEDMSPQLSPVFKSEAARAIVMEMASMRDSGDQPKKRVIPREKRRHHTVSSGRSLLDMDSTFSVMGSTRSCDDLDMERALRPRLNAPDVVRSTMSHKDFKYNENTIDSILGTPNKIVIPERYIPEQAPELSAEEQLQRMKKAESIRKMLSETSSVSRGEPKDTEEEQSSTLKKKMLAEKKQREHLLQLNQILAKQVMEKSKIVAEGVGIPTLSYSSTPTRPIGSLLRTSVVLTLVPIWPVPYTTDTRDRSLKALATLPLNMEPSFDEDDLSPVTPLPLFQQRDNYYS